MTITTEIKANWKAEKIKLQKEIASLKKSMTDYKTERKSEWKSFKSKFIEDIDEVEKSLKKLVTLHKK